MTVRRLSGRCLPYVERPAYEASIEQIKHASDIFETDAPEVARAKLQGLAEGCLAESEIQGVTQSLSLLLGLSLDQAIEARQLLFFAVRRLIQGLSSRHPAVLIFEDLHWADSSQFELLEYLVGQVTDAPVFLLVLARPELVEVQPDVGTSDLPCDFIELEPLAEPLAEAMLAGLAPNLTPGSDQARRLLEVAAGNPLFLEELAASLPNQSSTVGGLPVTVREAIASRIDSLPTDLRRVLLDASVIGSTFWRGVLAVTSDESAEVLDAHLDRLVSDSLVNRSVPCQLEGDEQFVFKHTLVRDVAYETLTRVARRNGHRKVARELESRVGGASRDLASILAHHWREAGEWRKAVEHLLVAAENARDGWAKQESAAFYRSALELVGSQDQTLSRLVRLQLGLGLVRLTEFEEGAGELDAVLPELEGVDALEAALARAWSAYWMEDEGAAVTFADLARSLAERLGDTERLAPAIAYQALSREHGGELTKALAYYKEARENWVDGSRVGEFAALNESQADVTYWLGDYSEAERLATMAFELGSDAHSLQPVLRGGGWRGLVMAAQGRSEEAIDWLDRMFETAQRLDPRWGAPALNYSSLAFRDMLDLPAARTRNLRALEMVRARGTWGMAELEAEIDLCLTDLMEKEFGRVEAAFPRLWEAALTGRAWRPWLAGGRLALVRAELAFMTASPESAVELAHDSLRRALAIKRRKYVAASRSVLGGALFKLGRTQEGLSSMRAAVAEADELGSPSARWQMREQLAKSLYESGDDDGAGAVFRQAGEVILAYAHGLNDGHRVRFLGADPIQHLLKMAGASPPSSAVPS